MDIIGADKYKQTPLGNSEAMTGPKDGLGQSFDNEAPDGAGSIQHTNLWGYVNRLTGRSPFTLLTSSINTLVPVISAHSLFVLVTGLYIVARLRSLTDYSLYFDEIFSLWAARRDWSDLMAFVADDLVHPPLFYLLLKIWISVGGESLLWLKLFPVLISIAAIGPFFLLCRELKLSAVEINLALVLMAVNGYLIHYAQEVRMYSSLLCFTLCSLWLFVRLLNGDSDPKKLLVALFAINLLLVYTHYYGWLVVGVQSIILMYWGHRKLLPFLIMVAGLVLCFSPWAYAVAQVAIEIGGMGGTLDQITRPDVRALLHFYEALSGSFQSPWISALTLLLFFSPIVLWAWHVFRGNQAEGERRADAFWWLLLFSSLPVVFAYAVSQVLTKSVWGDRSLIIVAAPYMLLVAMAIYRLRPIWVRTAVMLLLIGWAALSGFTEQTQVNKTHRVKWETLVHQMIRAEPLQANDIMVYTTHPSVAFAINFYLEQANERRFQGIGDKKITDVHQDHLWVSGYGGQEEERKVKEAFIGRGYHIGEGFKDGSKAFLFPVWRLAL